MFDICHGAMDSGYKNLKTYLNKDGQDIQDKTKFFFWFNTKRF
jgi:hypothetical protein